MAAGLGKQVPLNPVDNDQIRRHDTGQLGDGLVQVDPVKPGLHGPGHHAFQVFQTAGNQGLAVGLHDRYIDEVIAFDYSLSDFQFFKRPV